MSPVKSSSGKQSWCSTEKRRNCVITVSISCGGQKLYRELRFVLVEYNGTQSILAGTCLELDPLSMIRLYSFRFRIECTFRELKQQTGAFCYHFWSKHMPRLNYYRKKTEPSPLKQVENDHARRKILKAVRAVEMHMVLSCIALGTI